MPGNWAQVGFHWLLKSLMVAGFPAGWMAGSLGGLALEDLVVCGESLPRLGGGLPAAFMIREVSQEAQGWWDGMIAQW